MTDSEIIADAIRRHPDCTYGEVQNGLNPLLPLTRVVNLWRNEECALAGDPPRHVVEGYPALAAARRTE
jgi:hypothetical protein